MKEMTYNLQGNPFTYLDRSTGMRDLYYVKVSLDDSAIIQRLWVVKITGELKRELFGWEGRSLPTLWTPVLDEELLLDEGI